MKQITCPHCGDTYPDFDTAHVCSRGPYAVKLKPKMNERIRQLADEAEEFVEKNSLKSWASVEFEQKFAELIVQECSNFLKDTLDDHFAAEQLEEHFGVER